MSACEVSRLIGTLVVAHTGIAQRRRFEFMEDAALRCTIRGIALAAQHNELVLERAQAVEACADPGELSVDERVHLCALGRRIVHKAQQPRDVGQGNVQRPAVTNEARRSRCMPA